MTGKGKSGDGGSEKGKALPKGGKRGPPAPPPPPMSEDEEEDDQAGFNEAEIAAAKAKSQAAYLSLPIRLRSGLTLGTSPPHDPTVS